MKFVNHIDHVTWVFHQQNIARGVAHMERLFDVKFDEPRTDEDFGFTMYLCWEAGLEVVSPLPGVTDFNKTLHDYLADKGEGLMSIVFGVRDLEKTCKRLAADGFEPGEFWGNHPDSPWRDRVVIRESALGMHLNTYMIFGEIDYADGVVTIEN